MKPERIGRRMFLKTVSRTAAAGVIVGVPQVVPSRVLGAAGTPGANGRIVIGHIGVGGMGGGHLDYTLARMKRGDVHVAAVCDCDSRRLAAAQAKSGGARVSGLPGIAGAAGH